MMVTNRLCCNTFRAMNRGEMTVKYFTKEWYMAMQKSDLGICFRADERAAKLDEALYEELFEERCYYITRQGFLQTLYSQCRLPQFPSRNHAYGHQLLSWRQSLHPAESY